MSDYVAFVPRIDAAARTPNQVETNSSLKMSVVVSDIQKVLYPEWYYSGEIYSGESEG